jgi:5-methylcytosine-specific restriction endonuclease McrA
LIEHFCIDCGKPITGNGRTHKCTLCALLSSRIGKNHYNWIVNHNVKKTHYVKFTTKLKRKIRKRDNNKCVYCGLTEEEHFKLYKQALHIHHKDFNKSNFSGDNLITLCARCHIFTQKYREKKYADSK